MILHGEQALLPLLLVALGALAVFAFGGARAIRLRLRTRRLSRNAG